MHTGNKGKVQCDICYVDDGENASSLVWFNKGKKNCLKVFIVYVFNLFSLSRYVYYDSGSQLVLLHKPGFTLDIDWQATQYPNCLLYKSKHKHSIRT